MTDEFDDGRSYFDIEIEGRSPDTEIWLGDDGGHLVQKEVGTLRSSLIPGHYLVEFELGSTCYPIDLRGNLKLTQQEIEAGLSCERPVVRPVYGRCGSSEQAGTSPSSYPMKRRS